jgi:hypothetical protein
LWDQCQPKRKAKENRTTKKLLIYNHSCLPLHVHKFHGVRRPDRRNATLRKR